MTTLWLDPGFGASGDMVLGVLLGLGAPLEQVRAELDGLDLDGWRLDAAPTQRAGLAAVKATVTTDDADQPHRAWSTIDAMLAASDLPADVAVGARATFRRLGEVEAAIHRVELDDVHFHEVGAIDAIVDIVGSWSALHQLGIDRVVAGPVGLGGGGTVAAAHGLLPVPAPATLALLDDVPVRGIDSPTETVTPTGAALLTTMVTSWGQIPPGRLGTTARGAGGRDPETHPNVLTGLLLDSADGEHGSHRSEPATAADAIGGTRSEPAVVLATNLDDVTAELLGHVIEVLLAAGADDAWLVPIGMKKNRPGTELRVLCRPDLVGPLAEIVFAETGTLGLRTEPVTKHVAERHVENVQVRGCIVRIKVGPHGAKPEHDDLRTVAQATGVPLRQLAIEALRARSGGDPGHEHPVEI